MATDGDQVLRNYIARLTQLPKRAEMESSSKALLFQTLRL